MSFRRIFVHQIPKEDLSLSDMFRCSSDASHLVENPVLCQKCNQMICFSCYSNVKKCPICKLEINDEKTEIPDFAVKMLNNIRLKCENTGCPAELNYGNYRNHVKECRFVFENIEKSEKPAKKNFLAEENRILLEGLEKPKKLSNFFNNNNFIDLEEYEKNNVFRSEEEEIPRIRLNNFYKRPREEPEIVPNKMEIEEDFDQNKNNQNLEKNGNFNKDFEKNGNFNNNQIILLEDSPVRVENQEIFSFADKKDKENIEEQQLGPVKNIGRFDSYDLNNEENLKLMKNKSFENFPKIHSPQYNLNHEKNEKPQNKKNEENSILIKKKIINEDISPKNASSIKIPKNNEKEQRNKTEENLIFSKIKSNIEILPKITSNEKKPKENSISLKNKPTENSANPPKNDNLKFSNESGLNLSRQTSTENIQSKNALPHPNTYNMNPEQIKLEKNKNHLLNSISNSKNNEELVKSLQFFITKLTPKATHPPSFDSNAKTMVYDPRNPSIFQFNTKANNNNPSMNDSNPSQQHPSNFNEAFKNINDKELFHFNIETLTIDSLKVLLKYRELPQNGNKEDLIRRLNRYLEEKKMEIRKKQEKNKEGVPGVEKKIAKKPVSSENINNLEKQLMKNANKKKKIDTLNQIFERKEESFKSK